MTKTKGMSIKEVAALFNITPNKLRFYEKKGLITPARDEDSGYRIYTQEDVLRIQAILTYRTLELSLEDIKKLLEESDGQNMMIHFLKQLERINNTIHSYKILQSGLNEIVDKVFIATTEKEKLDGVIAGAKQIAKVNEIKGNWEDKWSFNEWASTYDEAVLMDRGSLKLYRNYEEVLQSVYEWSKPSLDKLDAKVLEIGVGTGNLACKYLNDGVEIIGVDQSPQMLLVAKQKFPSLSVSVGEFLKLPFENESFDVIVSTYAFHHLNDTQKKFGLEEMLRVLKKDGAIIIGDMMFKDTQEQQMVYESLPTEAVEEIEDEYYTNVEELSKHVHQLGYELEFKHIDYIMGIIKISRGDLSLA